MAENRQFRVAFEILSAYYGLPKWESNPKEGQSRDEIVNTWCCELSKYTVDQVREACYWLTRRIRTMAFPTIAVLMNELLNKEPENIEKEKEPYRLYNHLLRHSGLTLSSPTIEKLTSQRAIYRIYELEVDGYRYKEDTGYENGSIPEYLKQRSKSTRRTMYCE